MTRLSKPVSRVSAAVIRELQRELEPDSLATLRRKRRQYLAWAEAHPDSSDAEGYRMAAASIAAEIERAEVLSKKKAKRNR